jgi:hypothetical protein
MWSSQQLENLSESIIGTPSIFIIGKSSEKHIEPYWYVINESHGPSPFHRRIHITGDMTVDSAGMQQFDAVFKPQDGRDYSLILAYIMNTQGALYIQSSIELPEQFITALYRGNGTGSAPSTTKKITLATVLHHYPRSIRLYSSIFFPQIAETAATEITQVIHFLRASAILPVSEDEVRAYIKELRIASGALVWTRLGETRTQGSIYWYDPADCISPVPTSGPAKEHMQKQVLRSLRQLTQQMHQICGGD